MFDLEYFLAQWNFRACLFSKEQILKALVSIYKYNSVGDFNDHQRYTIILLQFKWILDTY